MTADTTRSDEDLPTPFDSDLERRAAAYRRLRAEGRGRPHARASRARSRQCHTRPSTTASRTVDDFGGSAGQDDVPDVDKNIAAMVEPRHGKVRRIMNSVVAFHRSQQIEPYLQDLVNRLHGRDDGGGASQR